MGRQTGMIAALPVALQTPQVPSAHCVLGGPREPALLTGTAFKRSSPQITCLIHSLLINKTLQLKRIKLSLSSLAKLMLFTQPRAVSLRPQGVDNGGNKSSI